MKKGFTLIELLIVIGILGILAAGLLAAIDPLDQLRKGRDQTKRNISVELVNALNRYYASRGSMPWGTGTLAATTSISNIVGSLTTQGELKSTFLNGIPTSGNPIYVYADADLNVYSCVQQESHAVNVNAVYSGFSGVVNAGCPAANTGCSYCAR